MKTFCNSGDRCDDPCNGCEHWPTHPDNQAKSRVTKVGPIVIGYDMGSPDGDYYCEMHYDKATGIFTVLNTGRVLTPNVELTGVPTTDATKGG